MGGANTNHHHLLPTFTPNMEHLLGETSGSWKGTSRGRLQILPLSLMHWPSNECCMILHVNLITHFKMLKFVLMLRINYSWYLDLHIRWFIMCTQTILAVPKVAWVNLLPLTWVNAASWPCFHHLAFWCFVLLPGATFFFLTHLYLLAFAFAVLLIAQTNACSGGTCSCYGEKQTKGELLSLSPAFLAGARH